MVLESLGRHGRAGREKRRNQMKLLFCSRQNTLVSEMNIDPYTAYPSMIPPCTAYLCMIDPFIVYPCIFVDTYTVILA